MLALHLLQSALVHVNTLLLQNVLDSPGWDELLSAEDRRALSPLFWSHINPYGRFRLDWTPASTSRHRLAEGSLSGTY